MCDETIWPIRSYLFVPAHRADLVAKAARFGPHAVILDLEDSVPPGAKEQARASLREHIDRLAAQSVAPFVRINEMSAATDADVAAAVVPGLAGLVLPKAANAAQILELKDKISFAEGQNGLRHGQVCLLPLPETAEGLRGGFEIAGASRRVKGLFGSIAGTGSGDVARAFGFRPSEGGLEQLYLNSKTVLDSRAAGANFPLAGIIGTDLDDLVLVEALIRRAKAMGYTGVAVVHPSHVQVAHEVFRPTADEAAYFEGLLAAFAQAEQANIGAIRYQNQMVDYAMLAHAEEVVAEFRRLGRSNGAPR